MDVVRVSMFLRVSLFLLVCSLSVGAELQDTEVTEQRSVAPQSCPSDIHAVLRDISVKLAENRLMIQEQVVKLDKYEERIKQLEILKQAQAVKLKEFENQVDSQQQVQDAELRSLKTQTSVTENQLDALKRDREVGRVAFSASLLESGSGYAGLFSTDTTLVFKHVVTNIGSAYNKHTGSFTAPVGGAYHFDFFIGGDGSTTNSEVSLVKNEELIFTACEKQQSGWSTTGNGATLLLEPGDVVFVRLRASTKIFDDRNHYSTFSGHLLFTM